MPDQEPPGQIVKELLARVQELVDATPAEAGHPLEWTVPAYYLGDMSALRSRACARAVEPPVRADIATGYLPAGALLLLVGVIAAWPFVNALVTDCGDAGRQLYRPGRGPAPGRAACRAIRGQRAHARTRLASGGIPLDNGRIARLCVAARIG